MKRPPDHSNTSPAETKGPRYWRSLGELSGTPAFREWLHREFPQGASEMEGVNRRHFLKIMAASFAAAGLGAGGCRRPEAHIRPFAKETGRQMPGLPVYYASSLPRSSGHLPVVVETHGARPTKVEGNQLLPRYGGASDLPAQASILDLYDPDRATQSSAGTTILTTEQVADRLRALHDKYLPVGGQGLAILAQPSPSPTRLRLRQELQRQFPRLVWAEYEAAPTDAADRAVSSLYGTPLRSLPRLEKARRILALDCDFLGQDGDTVAQTRAFAATRRVQNKEEARQMSRLYSIESNFTLTGGMADHRLRLATAQIPAFLEHLAKELAALQSHHRPPVEEIQSPVVDLPVDPAWLAECARDLHEHPGQSLILAGAHLPVEIHRLVHWLNVHYLDARGHTLDLVELPPTLPTATLSDLATLAGRNTANDKVVETLLILGGNPAYDAPADLDWNQLAAAVPEIVRYGYYYDETSLLSTLHLAATHPLESWGDGRTADGVWVPVQPMILPLFNGWQELEVLARLAGLANPDSYGLVRDTFLAAAPKAEAAGFDRFLQDGYWPDSQYPLFAKPLLARFERPPLASAQTPGPEALEVRLVPDAKVGDGRYANNGWLQECPDPMSKLAWDNAILVSPALAEHLGFDPASGRFLIGGVAKKNATFKRGREEAPLAELTVQGRTVRGPIHIQPGLADWTVVLNLGHGRAKAGRIGTGAGFSAYPLAIGPHPLTQAGARLKLTGKTYRLANTQEHWSMEGRDIIREGNVENFLEDPAFAKKMGLEAHSPPIYGKDQDQSLQYLVTHQPRGNSAYQTPVFTAPQQWGMSIDLNTCTGCNACVVACQSENNIPIVGKDQVMRGREMHWIRLDRYYASGDVATNRDRLPRDPQTSVMPMLCQHCEMAPCEQVCPVNATVHDEQGLNVMAYNRCVGTRYCANNCPYKVRRFNFFDWNKREIGHFYEGLLGPNRYKQGYETDLQKMRANPEVTVRMRGVMEKCTYCQQRIENAKIAQLVKAGETGDVKVPDGLIRTACQQVCPAGAIAFGDLADSQTAVSRTKTSDRDYAVLGFLNVRPRTTYLARLRNPNPRLPAGSEEPFSLREYRQESGHLPDNAEAHGTVEKHNPVEAPHGDPHGTPNPTTEPTRPPTTPNVEESSSAGRH